MIESIKVNELIEFHRKVDGKSKNRLAYKLKNRKKKIIEKKEGDNGGGNYWISSESCILNVFKTGNKELYDEKISYLEQKLTSCDDEKIKTKTTLERNIQRVENFKEFDLTELKPIEDLKYNIPVKKEIKDFIYKELLIFVNPSTFYSYKKEGQDYIGALWLVSSKEGFKRSEIGVFCELLYHLISIEYGDKYNIEKDYCCVVDIYNASSISYNDLEIKKVFPLLESIISSLKEM